MKTWQMVAVISLVVIGVVYLIVPRGDVAPIIPSGDDAPWGVKALDNGRSRVFGLTLGEATLADAMARFGHEPKLALFDTPGKGMTLEVFYDEVTLGGLSGRIILVLGASQETLAALRDRAGDKKIADSGAARYALSTQDMRAVRTWPIAALTYIPYADLNAAIVTQRFGRPAERLRTRDGLEHWLYPQRGLDVALNPDGRDLIQYVAPVDFERLLVAPLQRAPADKQPQNTDQPVAG